jgi:type IV pilus assembly protein PilV
MNPRIKPQVKLQVKQRMNYSFQSGTSLIEVLVTMTITAFALLGLLGMQTRMLAYQKDAFDRLAGASAVQQLAERMRGNVLGYAGGNYGFSLHATDTDLTAVPACATTDACTAGEVAARDLAAWGIEMRRRLPGAALYVESPANAPWSAVSVAWAEPMSRSRASGAPDATCQALQQRLSVTLPANYRCFSSRVFP